MIEMIRTADGPSSILAARNPELVINAVSAAIHALAKLHGEPRMPRGFANALQRVAQSRDRYLGRLRETASAVERAAQRVRDLDLPETSGQAFFQGVAQANSSSTAAGLGALGGAKLGTLIFPGVGTVVGGALGAVLGSTHSSRKNQEVLAAFDAANDRLAEVVDEVSDLIWDECVEEARAAGCRLESSSFFSRADEAWQLLNSRILGNVQPGSTAQAAAELKAFIDEWGPKEDALHLLLRLSIAPYDSGVDVAPFAAMAVELFPGSAQAHEDAADVQIALGNWAAARSVAESGLRAHPNHDGLGVSLLEALAAGGHKEQAEREERKLLARVGRTATIHRARGLVRAGAIEEAAAVVTRWMSTDPKPLAVAYQVDGDAILSVLRTRGALPPLSRDDELRGIVEAHLDADGEKRFMGLPPGERATNARVEFLGYREGEKVLFFLDWSVWGNAKTGFALTNERVVWKCLWEDPVKVHLQAISPHDITVMDSRLHVGEQSVDMEDAVLAEAACSALFHLCCAVADDDQP